MQLHIAIGIYDRLCGGSAVGWSVIAAGRTLTANRIGQKLPLIHPSQYIVLHGNFCNTTAPTGVENSCVW